jgi:hypothetical protein
VCSAPLPDDIEVLPQGYIYRRSELSENGKLLVTHEFIASGASGAAVERVSAKKLLGASQIFGMLNRAGFEAVSFCKRALNMPPHHCALPLHRRGNISVAERLRDR